MVSVLVVVLVLTIMIDNTRMRAARGVVQVHLKEVVLDPLPLPETPAPGIIMVLEAQEVIATHLEGPDTHHAVSQAIQV